MAVSSFHMLAFSLLNPYSLSFDRDGPFPALYRLLTTRSPSIYTLDLSSYTNKTILITGATSGCGLECAKGLARAGCCLLLTTRDPHRGEAVQKEIQHEANLAGVHTKVNMLELDMASFKSIATFMSQLKGVLGHGHGHLDIAILNAGVYQTGFQVCPETGLEKTIQVNFLATCALSILLHPHLSHSKEGRILFISSEAHAWANPKQSSTHLLLEHLNNPTSDEYSCYQRYHISKLLLVLWGRELSSRREWNAVSVASVSPGFTRSKLFREFNSSVVARALEYVVCRSSEQGASQYILALEDLIEGKGKGGFWSDGGWRWPSTPTTCTSGREIRTTLYADVMGALKELGEMEELLDPGHSLK